LLIEGRKGLAILIIIAVMMTTFSTAVSDINRSHQNCVMGTAGESAREPLTFCRAPPNGTLLLHVIDNSSLQDISDAYVVSLSQPTGQPMLIGSTNSTGYLTFSSLVPGSYEIIVSKNWYFNYTFSPTVNDNSTARYEVRLLTILCSVSFQILEASTGNPIQGVAVVLAYVPPGLNWVNLTDYTGFVYFNSIPFGNYTLSLSKNGYSSFNMNMTILPGLNAARTLTLAPTSQGGGGSGGGILILPVVSVIGLLALVGVISMLVVTRRHGQGEDTRHSHEWLTDYAPRVAEGQRQPVSAISSPSERVCSHCGTSIDIDRGDFCPKCGSNVKADQVVIPIQGEEKRAVRLLGKCMICNLAINENEEVLWCPFCGNMAHKVHMLEWLHVKNYCPFCYMQLSEYSFR
jgi:Zn finger protein HypA/HybF involved in hydrogenase expression